MTVDNPFWEAVKDCVEPDSLRGNPVVGEFRLDLTVEECMARSPNRLSQRFGQMYSKSSAPNIFRRPFSR